MSTVSIVLATYNGERFIKEQLDTIKNQSITPNEVIIGDDRSSDNTVQIVDKYIKSEQLSDNWHFVVNKTNKGYAKNFIDLALMASGDYIFFSDQDDIWDLRKIERMSGILDENPDISLLCSNLEPFYYEEGARKWDKKDLDAMTNNGNIEKPIYNYFNFFCQRSGCTMCIRKDYLHAIESYWTLNWAHDDFVWKMAMLDGKCAIYQHCFLKRRMHANNASSMKIRTREWRKEQIKAQLAQYQSYLTYAGKNKASDKKLEIIRKNENCAKLRIHLLEKGNPLLWFRLLNQFRNCYPRRQAIILDLYLTIFSQYKGVN